MSQKLFVGGLSWNTTSADLAKAFEPFGAVVESTVVTDRETGRSRGFGFVTFETEDAAKAAIDKLNGSELDGRTIRVDLAQSGGDRRGGGGGGGGPRGGRGGGRGFGGGGGGGGGGFGGGYGGGGGRGRDW